MKIFDRLIFQLDVETRVLKLEYETRVFLHVQMRSYRFVQLRVNLGR